MKNIKNFLNWLKEKDIALCKYTQDCDLEFFYEPIYISEEELLNDFQNQI